jgi:hypothetical protein
MLWAFPLRLDQVIKNEQKGGGWKAACLRLKSTEPFIFEKV